jgi:hypothetical protein
MRLSKWYFVFISLFFLSCKSLSDISGTYKLEKNNVVSMHITLNTDKTFVQYIKRHECAEDWFFGFFTRKHKHIYLTQISSRLEHLRKKDTIIYNSDPFFKYYGLFVYENGISAVENASVFINGQFGGRTDNVGFIKLPNYQKIDSITIKTPIGLPRSFNILGNDYNQIFIMLYDYTFEPCGNYYFQNKFKVSKNGLVIDKNNHFVKTGYKAILQKIVTLQK